MRTPRVAHVTSAIPFVAIATVVSVAGLLGSSTTQAEQRLGRGTTTFGGTSLLYIGTYSGNIQIFDEATEGLAPLIVAEIWRTIGDIRASGIASLVVDRNYRTVLANTDRAFVLEKGRVVLHGESNALSGDTAALHRHLGV